MIDFNLDIQKKKILLLCIFPIFLQCNSLRQEDKNRVLSFFQENFSYEWNSIESREIRKELTDKCLSYDSKLDLNDKLLLKKVYLERYDDKEYYIVEFDFKEAFDNRVCFVISYEDKEVIGYFERYLA